MKCSPSLLCVVLAACGSTPSGPAPALPALPACTPGVAQTCNLLVSVSALWGSCRSDGTCACNPGFEVEPVSGLCRPADGGAWGCGDATCGVTDFCTQRNHAEDSDATCEQEDVGEDN